MDAQILAEADISKAMIGLQPGNKLKLCLLGTPHYPAFSDHGAKVVHTDDNLVEVELLMDFFLPINLNWFTYHVQPLITEIESHS